MNRRAIPPPPSESDVRTIGKLDRATTSELAALPSSFMLDVAITVCALITTGVPMERAMFLARDACARPRWHQELVGRRDALFNMKIAELLERGMCLGLEIGRHTDAGTWTTKRLQDVIERVARVEAVQRALFGTTELEP